MDIISVALKRHSTKAFDASQKNLTPGTGRADQNSTAIQPFQHQLPAVAFYRCQH